MRGDRDLGMNPQRAVGRQRLLRENVERCACECAVVERGDDVGIDLQRPASGVDEEGATGRAISLELAKQSEI